MAFKPPPSVLQKVLKFKAIQHKEGRVFLWGIPCFITELYSFIYLQRLFENEIGIEKTASILYSTGYLQAEKGIKMITDRFGYAKTIQEKKKLIDFNMGQSDVIGMGQFRVVRADFENEVLIIRGESPIAMEYKRFFGIQKAPTDHFMRGLSDAMGSLITNKKCLCVETRCVATGNQYCEFVVKPIERWDKSNPLFKSQQIKRSKTMKELGAKIEPYIISAK